MATKKPIAKRQEVSKRMREMASSDLAGLGSNVVKIVDSETGDNICYIGYQDSMEKIYFPKPITIEQIVEIAEFVCKKKFERALSKGNLEKAQKLANKKF
jgi:hypothetical protein